MATMNNEPQVDPKEAFENPEDAALILGDQDETLNGDDLQADDTMGADGGEDNPLSLENEPDEFVRGEVDVKEQMDRTTERLDYVATSSLERGARDEDFGKPGENVKALGDDDLVPTELGSLSMDEAALQGEELHEKTLDQLMADEADNEGPVDGGEPRRSARDFVEGADHPAHLRKHGHQTGAYTDIGAGRSGVTRRH